MIDSAVSTAAMPLRKAGETVELLCGAMVHGGRCIAHADDDEATTFLVSDALPDERVVATLQKRKGRVWFAAARTVVSVSPHRVKPPCPYVPDCGGCQLQHATYDYQVALKRGIVEDALRRQHVTVDDIVVHATDKPWRYRWRGEFHAVPGKEGMHDAGLGFHRRESHQPIAIDDCLIHHESMMTTFPLVRDAVQAHATKDLSTVHLTVGERGNEVVVRPNPKRSLAVEALDATLSGKSPAVRWSADSTTLHWRDYVFRVSAESFIQVNWEQMDVLYGVVLHSLPSTSGRIVDAYAGIGVLSTALAERAEHVTCIESNKAAARLGVLNAQLNGFSDRISYIPRPVEESLDAFRGADAVVLDPPRAGCESQVTGWLALAGPPTIVYVSCDPATLARDLRVLCTSGPYRVDAFHIVDMFAQTYHVECVAVLKREA